MSPGEIVNLLTAKFAGLPVAIIETAVPKAISIPSSEVKQVLQELHQNPATYFDLLSCMTGVDNGPEENVIEVIYQLYSIPFNLQLMVKVELDRENPEVETVSDIWQTANWHEREIYDLLGVKFKGHPDLRRILLPADWEGHPLRKDYKHQAYYRGIKVEY